jgi:hypothetical protein
MFKEQSFEWIEKTALVARQTNIVNLGEGLRELLNPDPLLVNPENRVSEKLASKAEVTRGRTYVTEFDVTTGHVRTWMECYDHLGVINPVHPKQINGEDLISPHYLPTARELGIHE